MYRQEASRKFLLLYRNANYLNVPAIWLGGFGFSALALAIMIFAGYRKQHRRR